AVGYGQAHADSETNIGGSTSITATDSVSVTAKGKASTKVVARATSNTLKFADVNPKNTAIAVAIADTELTVHTTVGHGVSITSTAGNVNILADATTSTKPDASTLSPVDGRAGVGAALAFENADVKAYLDGDIRATGPIT